MLETTLGNVYTWKEQLVMTAPVQTVNGMMININSTVEIGIDIEVTKARIKIIKDKKAVISKLTERARDKNHS